MTSASDMKLIVERIAKIPIPIGPSITSSIPKEVILAARRLVHDAKNESVRS